MADLKAQGQTVHDRLDALAEEHGLHATRPLTLRFDDEDGLARIATRMAAVRQDPPTTLGGRDVEGLRDLLDDPDLPETDALLFSLGGGAGWSCAPAARSPS